MRRKLPVLILALLILLQAFVPAVYAASENEAISSSASFCPFDTTSEGAGKAASTTRVGRWMSTEEYQAMKSSGKVQMSPNGNTTSIANPADPSAFGNQAKPGTIYVEFDVPTNSIRAGGNANWGQIPGPGSLWDRFNQSKGLPPITEMPNATNIQIMGGK